MSHINQHVPPTGNLEIEFEFDIPTKDQLGRDDRVSLHPLTPEQALRGLLATPPPAKD